MIIANTPYHIKPPVQASGTNAGATATLTGVSGKIWACVRVSGYSDLACFVNLYDNTTIPTLLVSIPLPTGGGGFDFDYNGDYIGTAGKSMYAVITASTAACSVSIVGGLLG